MPADKETDIIRIVIADDHDLYRIGLARYLEQERDLTVSAQSTSAEAGLTLVRQLQPHVFVLSDDLPGTRTRDVVARALRGREAPRVIVLSGSSPSPANIVEGLLAGARAYLEKSSSIEEVTGAIRAAAAGNAWLSAPVAEVVFSRLRDAPPLERSDHAADRLSSRELEVLKLISRGMDNAEIASALAITPNTAKNHVSNILTKLEVPSRLLAATYAIRHDLA
jgi:two-component system NarL family response regulator